MAEQRMTSHGRPFSTIGHDGARLGWAALTCTGSPP